MNAASSLTGRALEALAGVATVPASPPLSWDRSRSRVLRSFPPLSPPDRGDLLDGLLRTCGSRPLLLAAAVLVLLPALRLLLPASIAVPLGGAVVLLAGFTLIGCAASFLHEGAARRVVLLALTVGLVMRIAAAVFLLHTGGFPDEYGYYHPLAADAAACWQSGGPSVLATHPVVQGRAAYFYFLSAFYLLVGPDLMVARVVGIVMGLASAVTAGELARRLAGPRAAVFAVVLLALHPEHAFWSATVARDTFTVLLVLVGLWAAARSRGTLVGPWLIPMAAVMGLLALNSFLTAGALAVVLLLWAFGAALHARSPSRRLVAVPLVLLATVAVAGIVLDRWGAFFNPSLFTAVRARAIGTVPDFMPGLVFEDWFDVISFLPAGTLFVHGAPFPWEAVHLHRAVYGVGALVGTALTILGASGLIVGVRRLPARWVLPLLFVLLLTGVLALLEGTQGIVIRHRLPVTAVLTVAAAALLAGARRPESA